jgi:hypothetical protein
MPKVLLLGTWLKKPWPTSEEVSSLGENVSVGGMTSQMLLTGTRIVVKRDWIVDERTWKNGMTRSVQEGDIAELTDDQLVVVEEKPATNRRR